ncbi:hypothetical protein I317_05293 [Kwoniella heveanensis CBS 569]|nr:hypothetical protein I317_05293 [Kwoniella heveanensis CBS 569]
MSGLEDLFTSPPRAAPPRYSRSPSPISPARPPLAGAATSNANPLFLSPGGAFDGSNFGSPSDAHRRKRDVSRHRSISPSVGASRHRAGLGPPESSRRANANANANPGSRHGTNHEPSFATYELETAVQARAHADFEDPFAELNDPTGFGADGDDDDADGGNKRKRVMAKVDADRLTSGRGFPALCRAAKKFKVKGKGNEAKDLRNLLNMYQMWAHGMFPKGDFAHTINRVEVVCRTRRMESAISGYRDAFHPRARTPSPPAVDGGDFADTVLTPPHAGASSGSEPLFSARPEADMDADMEHHGAGDGLDPDLEEMMALEEMEREAAAAAAAEQTTQTRATHEQGGTGANRPQNDHRQRQEDDPDGPPVLDEEDEWEGLYD